MSDEPGIFISYRRDDSRGSTGRLSDALGDHFGASRVFRDVDDIAPGVEFWQRIHQVLDVCSVVLVVIGNTWVSAMADGHRRLDGSEDFVRREVATALERGVITIPILVDGASVPSAHELPEDIAPLLDRNAVELSDQRWRYDVQNLIAAVAAAVTPDSGPTTFHEVAPDDWYKSPRTRRLWPWKRSTDRQHPSDNEAGAQ